MNYEHGMKLQEVKTITKTPSSNYTGVIVAVGTAPINQGVLTNVNKPVLATNIDEYREALGHSEDFETYTLSEVAEIAFNEYGVAPVVFINVFDPVKHVTQVDNEAVTLTKQTAEVQTEGILLSSLEVKLTEEGQPLLKGTDYLATFNGKNVAISALSGGAIANDVIEIVVSYKKLDKQKVTEADIIGGYDTSTGKRSGLEVLNAVFPTLNVVPGTIIVPGYSTSPPVAAVLKAKSKSINSLFKAMHIVEVDQSIAKVFTEAPITKEEQQIISEQGLVLYGTPLRNGKEHSFSTHAAAAMARTDIENKNLPHVSPSNKKLNIDSFKINGNEGALDLPEANFLNGHGIVTALNFNGFRLWGNRTAAFPENTDPKDSFIPVRRMFNFIHNNIIIRYWTKVDNPMNKRLIDSFVDDTNIWLNSLTSDEALLGGKVEYRTEANPSESLLEGKIKFHIALAAPLPAEVIEAEIEFDTNYLTSLI